MTQRLLKQLNWSAGQTEGDPVDYAVRRLYNVEIGDPGKLTPRGVLWGAGDLGGYHQHCRIKGDPTGSDLEYWDVFLGESSVALTSSDGQQIFSVNLTTHFGQDIDPEDTSMWPSAEGVDFAFWLADGSFGGIRAIRCIELTGSYVGTCRTVEGTNWALPSSSSEEKGWTFINSAAFKPTLKLVEARMHSWLCQAGEYTNGCTPMSPLSPSQGDPVWFTYEEWITAASNQVVGDHDHCLLVNKSVYPNGGYGKQPVIEYVAQYVFVDGSFSVPSNSVIYNSYIGPGGFSQIDNLAIGMTLVRNSRIDPTIASIRIYKKVLDYGDRSGNQDQDFTLAYEFPVKQNAIEEMEKDYGNMSYTYDYEQVVQDQIAWMPNFAKFLCHVESATGISTALYVAWGSGTPVPRRSAIGGWMQKNVGWMKAPFQSGNKAVFLAPHLYCGDAWFFWQAWDIYPNQPNQRGWFDWAYRGKIMLSNFNGSPVGGLVIPTTKQILPRMYEWNAGAGQWWSLPLTIGDAWEPHMNYMGHVIEVDESTLEVRRFSQDVTNWENDTSRNKWRFDGYTENSWGPSLALDMGLPGLETLDYALGTVADDIINPSMRSLARIGGRLFALNVAYENELYQARLLYTGSGRRIFSRSNFIDYSGVDEGRGLVIGAWKSLLALFYSNSVYLLDISSGSNLNWRQIGSLVASPPANKFAVCTTASGIAWAGEDVYFTSGNEIVNLTHQKRRNITVRDSWRALIEGRKNDVRLHYVDVSNQLWACVGNHVFVCDMDSFAWHEHIFREDLYEIVSINTNADSSIEIICKYGNDQRMGRFIMNDEVNPDFVFGVDFVFDAGVPEATKKMKTLYTRIENGTVLADITVLDQLGAGVELENYELRNNNVSKISISGRGGVMEGSLMITRGATWQTKIDSIGLVYKAKKLK